MSQPPEDKSVLLVEDEYFIAEAMAMALELGQWRVVGPFSSVPSALQALDGGESADVAVLDVNLNGEPVFPLADRLSREHMPFVLTTGYDVDALPADYTKFPHLQKPVSTQQLLACLNRLLAGQGS